LLVHISENKVFHSVSADGAYDTKTGHEATADRQAAAIIFICKNLRLRAEVQTGAQVKTRFEGDAGIMTLDL